jgi:hypothetical protein
MMDDFTKRELAVMAAGVMIGTVLVLGIGLVAQRSPHQGRRARTHAGHPQGEMEHA